ncbi:MAG TPA: glycosyltransferase [Gemmatimonadota bacterium]|nr:glycosyltransferase [Gemmatimonadota bacterium]
MTTFGSRGDLNPYLALGHGLAARGHEATIATHEYYRSTVEAEGLGFRPVRPDAMPDDRKLFVRAMGRRRGPMVVLKEIVIPRLPTSYEDTLEAARDADLIVTHPLSFAGPIVAEKLGMPWVSTVLAPMLFFSQHDFPVVPVLPRAYRLHWIPGMTGLLGRLFRGVTRSWTGPVRELRAELGLPPGANPLFEGQHSSLLVLGLFSRVLAEPQPDWPPRTRLTGFLFRDASPDDDPQLERVRAFLDAGPPPIVFTLGSSAVMAAGSFYDESLAAARLLGMRALLLVGDDPTNRPAGPFGDDAIAVERAPHEAIFPRVAAIVHHGGIGTLGQALRAGRPMLVVPWTHDQPDNARRAVRLGVARSLVPGRYRAKRTADELRTLLDDPFYIARSAAVAETIRSEDGVREACEGIESAVLES